ncbi:hypothetical protein M0R04_00610 [Candidatus Dojkabacteria bacterium]|jgi:DNA polymerase|nr:hypothetical protein [Candidatus Dojkabacteria bacterium]
MQQLTHLHPKYDQLQLKFGDVNLKSIYGAGKIDSPNLMFIFMNPTARNISSSPNWKGLRAPWIGTKQVWDIFNSLSLLDTHLYTKIRNTKTDEWDVDFANEVYSSLENHSVFLTNLAKCTQVDARPLSNMIFKEYLDLIYEEIECIQPKKIIAFGNQVSSVLLKKNISVGNYSNNEKEILRIKERVFDIFPTYYPVGQGRRNMQAAIERINLVMMQQ